MMNYSWPPAIGPDGGLNAVKRKALFYRRYAAVRGYKILGCSINKEGQVFYVDEQIDQIKFYKGDYEHMVLNMPYSPPKNRREKGKHYTGRL